LTYVDSSVLVALYIPESFSVAARAIIYEAAQVPFTALHDLELPNAFERLVGRGLITRKECRAVLQQLEDDIENRRLARFALDLAGVFADATELSRRYAAKYLARSLDLLHIAAAHYVECTSFVSADDRQLAVAKASGLRIVDVKRTSRPGGR
jgi:predicted nucleic acid-binding protein